MDVYCISLVRRTDRREHMAKMALRYPSIRIHIVDAIECVNGYVGGNLSHKSVIRWAKTTDLPYIFILEDDCDILLSDTELESCMRKMVEYSIEHPEIEIINGCGNLDQMIVASVDKFQEMYFLRSPTVYTAHFILYTRAGYDKLITSSIDVPADVVTNYCDMVYTYPYIATQLTSYSDIQKTIVDYINIQNSEAFVANYLNHLNTQ